MYFRNRQEAAALLAEKLLRYKGENPLVLAIPRGGVPMAKIIAEALEGEMDVALVRKLGRRAIRSWRLERSMSRAMSTGVSSPVPWGWPIKRSRRR